MEDWLIKPWEELWVTHQPYLLKRGYKLPDRYSPNWIPSWKTGKRKGDPLACPDSSCMRVSRVIPLRLDRLLIVLCCQPGGVLDAIRVADGTKVVLKLARTDRDIPTLEYLNSPVLLADPRNHTFPLLEKISVPDREDVVWIVMPLLLLAQDSCHPFRYISEVVEYTKQFLEVSNLRFNKIKRNVNFICACSTGFGIHARTWHST
jgi:hypothetical protein